MLGTKSTSQVKKLPNNNQIETLKGLMGGVGHSINDDLLKSGSHDALTQILGRYESRQKSTRGELRESEELDVTMLALNDKKEMSRKQDVTPGIDYRREILQYRETSSTQEVKEIENKIEEILFELRRLVDTSSVLQAEFRQVSMEQAPELPGKYHVSFLEWLLQIIKTARIKVEDSGSWLSALSSKKGKRQYWAMFKKHGTTFGLSNERVVATQTG